MGLSNVGGYLSETHLNLKSCKISLVNNIPFSLHMFLIFCTDHVSITTVTTNETSHNLSLRYVSDRYPMLHKAPDCDPE